MIIVVWVSANVLLSDWLFNVSGIDRFTDKLDKLLPTSSNVVLIYSGNPKLTTEASVVPAVDAPNSLVEDCIRKGGLLLHEIS